MNIVLVADKKSAKVFEELIKLDNVNILGIETKLKADFVKKTAESYNPHVLVIIHGVQSKNFDFFDSIPELQRNNPKMRIIYCFGKVNKTNEQQFLSIFEKLRPYGIYDILPYSVHEMGFRRKFLDVLENPMSADDVMNVLQNNESEQNTHSRIFYEEIEKITDSTPVNLSKTAITHTYDDKEVITVDEPSRLLTEKQCEHITIAIGTIAERQTGCTLAAFEITRVLNQLGESTALFLDRKIYAGYISYHSLDTAENGCEINGITLYPMNLYEEKSQTVKFSICALESELINQADARRKIFELAKIKICICSFYEWDIQLLAEYLNSPLPYLKEINYIFFPVSQANFMKFSKQLTKGHCKSYRIRNSPDYTTPCEWNANVYKEILAKYVDIEKRRKRLGIF